jgi:hypothetical protein
MPHLVRLTSYYLHGTLKLNDTIGLPNENAVAASTSGPRHDSRQIFVRPSLSRDSTIYNDNANDNLAISRSEDSRAAPRVPNFNFRFTPVGYETTSQSISCLQSRIPSVATDLNKFVENACCSKAHISSFIPDRTEQQSSRIHSHSLGMATSLNKAFDNASRSVSRIYSLIPGHTDASHIFRAPIGTNGGLNGSSYQAQPTQSHVENIKDNYENTSRSDERMTGILLNIQDELMDRDRSGNAALSMSHALSLHTNMAKDLLKRTEDPSSPFHPAPSTQGHTGNIQGTSGSAARQALVMQKYPSAPASRALSRVPSAVSINDVIGSAARSLSRVQSSMSLLGDNLNGHQSKFFPTDNTLVSTNSSHNMTKFGNIGTRRPRKGSMAKASVALNQAYNAAGSRNLIAYEVDSADRGTPAPNSKAAGFDTPAADTNRSGNDKSALGPNISSVPSTVATATALQ